MVEADSVFNYLGICRSEGRGGSRNDPGGTPVHQPRGFDDHGVAVTHGYMEDGRVHILQDKHSVLRDDFQRSWAVSIGAMDKIAAVTKNLHKPAAGRSFCGCSTLPALDANEIVRDREGCQAPRQHQAHVYFLRCARAAFEVDLLGGVC